MKSFIKDSYPNTPGEFKSKALDLFRYQAEHNKIYSLYLERLGSDWRGISEPEEIPFMPISFFKNQKIKTGEWEEEKIFESSGTTGMSVSRHFIRYEKEYHENCLAIFRRFYRDPGNYIFLALLPSYLENNRSSLINMVDHLIKISDNDESGFYLSNYEEMVNTIRRLKDRTNRKLFIWGVTYALLDLAEKYELDLENEIVMETGGMKGRREELTRQEIHRFLKESFNLSSVHSEYGMTELMSQAYSESGGLFRTPPWMKIFIREINDPFTIDNSLRQGLIQIIDLANIHTCAFLSTEDLGKVYEDGTFEVLGRMDNSDVRGCNLLVDQQG